MGGSIYLVVFTTFVKNLAHVHLEIMFIALNEKSDLLQSL